MLRTLASTVALAALAAAVMYGCGEGTEVISKGGAGGTGGGTGGGGSPPLCSCAGDQLCDPQLGCVECLGAADCKDADKPVCLLGACRACGTSADCEPPLRCSPKEHQCKPPCAAPGDCSGDTPLCDPVELVCVACETNADCDEAPLCHPTTKLCVDCVVDGDCGAAAPVCDPAAGVCVDCLVSTDCPDGLTCDEHACKAACDVDADCTVPSRPLCHPSLEVCVQCVTSGDCAAQMPFCQAGTCVECVDDDDCPLATPTCAPDGSCV